MTHRKRVDSVHKVTKREWITQEKPGGGTYDWRVNKCQCGEEWATNKENQ